VSLRTKGFGRRRDEALFEAVLEFWCCGVAGGDDSFERARAKAGDYRSHPGAQRAAALQFAGYLGVDLADVDQEKAQALKLKEVRGAVITLIDHDAPAGRSG